MKLNRILLFLLAACTCVDDSKCQERWEASVSCGLNTDGWEWDAGLTYRPIPYLGIKLALGLAGEIQALEDWHIEDWWYDEYHEPYYDYDDKNYTLRFKFMPSIDLRSPTIIRLKSQDATFHVFATPGITLSPGATGSRNAQWFNWQTRAGIEMTISEFVIRIGYGITNFSLYSGRPYNENGLPSNPEHITHSGFTTLAYRF